MKKLVFISLVLIIALSCTFTLADGFDFMDSCIFLENTSSFESLVAKHNATKEEGFLEGDYKIKGLSFSGIASETASSNNWLFDPYFDLSVTFDPGKGASLKKPGKNYETLLGAFMLRYGDPEYTEQKTDNAIVTGWRFRTVKILFGLYNPSKDSPRTNPHIGIMAYHLSDEDYNEKWPEFPYLPTELISKTPSESSSDVASFTFRNGITAKSTKAEIIKSEGRDPDVEEANGIAYKNISVAGLSADLIYGISDNVLNAAMYSITEKHSNKNLFISDFNAVAEGLITKYGEPESRQPIWRNNLWKDSPDDYGLAISSGHLSYIYTWEVGGCTIDLMLTGDNYEISHTIMYNFNPSDVSEPNTTGL